MSEKIVVLTDHAPTPIGPYSQAIKCGNMLFMSGQLGIDPKTNQLAGPDTAAQLAQILKNIEAVLTYNGLTPGNIMRCGVFLMDLKDMPVLNEAFSKFFIYAPPARTTIQVAGLPLGARVEVEATAMITGGMGSGH